MWLDDVVTWINHEYVWDTDGFIPSCWPEHPHLVHDLAVLADQRRRAGLAHTSDALEDWHRFALPTFLDRMAARLKSHCETGHEPWPAGSRHVRHTSDPHRRRRIATYTSDTDLQQSTRDAGVGEAAGTPAEDDRRRSTRRHHRGSPQLAGSPRRAAPAARGYTSGSTSTRLTDARAVVSHAQWLPVEAEPSFGGAVADGYGAHASGTRPVGTAGRQGGHGHRRWEELGELQLLERLFTHVRKDARQVVAELRVPVRSAEERAAAVASDRRETARLL